MAKVKITELAAITAAQLADGDMIPVVDVSDTTMSSTGTNKRLSVAEMKALAETETNATLLDTLTTSGDILTRGASAPARITRADLAADTAFSSRYTALRTRPVGPSWSLTRDGLGTLVSSGLTTTGGLIAASTGGTDGNAVIPIFGTLQDFRASFKVTATKGTAGSKSYVGLTSSARGTLPSGSDFTFGIGYLQGSGLVQFRENVGSNSVLVADAGITSGDVFDVEIASIRSTALAAGQSTLGMYCVIRNAAGTVVHQSNGPTWNPALFPNQNILIRTNVAAGSLGVVRVQSGGLVAPGLLGEAFATADRLVDESVAYRLPANPNGKIVYYLHGFAMSPIVALDNVTFRTSLAALTAAGFTVAIPNCGGDLWGNNTAAQRVTDLHPILNEILDFNDPAAYLYGNSMGGGLAARLISDRVLPIKAAYLAQPAVNYESLSAIPSFTASFAAAYPTVAARQAADPLLRAASTYAGVPMMIVTSPDDTTVARTTNGNALATLVSGVTTVVQTTVTGNHNDASHFRPGDAVQFFQAYR